MHSLKLIALAALVALALAPFQSQANIASDIDAGVPADQVIANALAAGMTIDEVMDAVAQEVGSANIGMFAGSAARTLAVATDTSPGDTAVVTAVNAAVGAAAARNYSPRSTGQAYAANSGNFQPVSTSAIRQTTGVLSLSRTAPTIGTLAVGPGRGAPAVSAVTGGSGGGGGQAVEDALCEAIGSEPGCL